MEVNELKACKANLESLQAEFKLWKARKAAEDEKLKNTSAANVERIENDRIAVGRIVYEALAAGLDPYPRKEDAAFEWRDPKLAEGAGNPFAVLKKLKD